MQDVPCTLVEKFYLARRTISMQGECRNNSHRVDLVQPRPFCRRREIKGSGCAKSSRITKSSPALHATYRARDGARTAPNSSCHKHAVVDPPRGRKIWELCLRVKSSMLAATHRNVRVFLLPPDSLFVSPSDNAQQ